MQADIWTVLVDCRRYGRRCEQPLYTVELPRDVGLFRLWSDADGVDVMVKYGVRWYPISAAWRRLDKPCRVVSKSMPCGVDTFGNRVLKRMGVERWEPKR